MPRWSLQRRPRPAGTVPKPLERPPAPVDDDNPRFLTPQRVLSARLALASDMVDLVLEDGLALPGGMRGELEAIQRTLAGVRQRAKRLR